MSRIAVLGLVALMAACSEGEDDAAAQGAAPPPTEVSVVEATPEMLPIVNELPGRIAPTRVAEVRPRVSGILVERVFEQGGLVDEGDVLYRIDPAPFQVQVDSAEATLKRAEAGQALARQQAARQSELRRRKVVSATQYDDAVAALAQADADVAIARANLAAARLDLEYAEVKAPISGRIGRALVTEGALVSSSDTQPLATIQQLGTVYADFTQPVDQLMTLRRAMEAGALTSPDPMEARVRLRFDNGTEYAHRGRLLFSEAVVDATTGQVTLRAEFPNPDGDLLPGMYVRVLVEQGVQRNAIAVPQQAVQRDPGGRAQVYVVADDGTASLRSVRTGRVVGQRWVITEGLDGGEKVIVEGFQKIRPGAAVVPREWNPDATPADATPADATPADDRAG